MASNSNNSKKRKSLALQKRGYKNRLNEIRQQVSHLSKREQYYLLLNTLTKLYTEAGLITYILYELPNFSNNNLYAGETPWNNYSNRNLYKMLNYP